MHNVLPESVCELKSLVVDLHERLDKFASTKEEIEHEKERVERENLILREQIRLLRQKLFGRKSEKYELGAEEIQQLFPEWREEQASAPREKPEEVLVVAAHTRKKTGRKPIPDDLPRVVVEHDLSEAEKICACGCAMSRIGEESSEQLDIVPASYQVIRHVRYKYACKSCEGVESEEKPVKIAPAPPQMIPKSIASSRLLAHILVGKFCDSLPFYRQENQFMRTGIEISRANMCNWALQIYERCLPLADLLMFELLSGPVVNLDETTVQVLDEEEQSGRKGKSYMWLCRGGPPDKPAFRFHYHPSRSGDVAKDLLAGYKGYVQTDGYSGYDFLDTLGGVVHVGCWAHVRRKFVETIQAAGGWHGNGKADEALKMIRGLYQIEKELAGKEPDEIRSERVSRSQPLVAGFKRWLDENAPRTPPKTLLGKAFAYALNEWPKLTRYLEDGRLKIDNNQVENAIRPFVVGRKNWLFSKTPDGARASAFFYSIIETAKANGIEPFSYLSHLFDTLPQAKTVESLWTLLPQNVDKNLIAPYVRKK